MNSKRIMAIASLVDKDASVIDIGTDHAYVPIYLIKNNITNIVDATDISQDVLKQSKTNIIKYNLDKKINLYLSDGFKKIEKKYDVAIISGMGTSTILEILNNDKIPNTLIIQSNRQIPFLRKEMNNKGYKIDRELFVLENSKYYIIIKYVKGKELLTDYQLEYGKKIDKDYLNYELKRLENNYNKNNNKVLKNKIVELKKVIEKIPD